MLLSVLYIRLYAYITEPVREPSVTPATKYPPAHSPPLYDTAARVKTIIRQNSFDQALVQHNPLKSFVVSVASAKLVYCIFNALTHCVRNLSIAVTDIYASDALRTGQRSWKKKDYYSAFQWEVNYLVNYVYSTDFTSATDNSDDH